MRLRRRQPVTGRCVPEAARDESAAPETNAAAAGCALFAHLRNSVSSGLHVAAGPRDTGRWIHFGGPPTQCRAYRRSRSRSFSSALRAAAVPARTERRGRRGLPAAKARRAPPDPLAHQARQEPSGPPAPSDRRVPRARRALSVRKGWRAFPEPPARKGLSGRRVREDCRVRKESPAIPEPPDRRGPRVRVASPALLADAAIPARSGLLASSSWPRLAPPRRSSPAR